MDETPDAAELQVMTAPAVARGGVDLIHRHNADAVARFRSGRGDKTYVRVDSAAQSRGADALPDIAITDVVDEVGRDRPCVACCDALAIVLGFCGCAQAGKLLSAADDILLQVAAHKDVVGCGGRPINLQDAGVVGVRSWRGERVRAFVDAVAYCRAVRNRNLREVIQNGCVRSGTVGADAVGYAGRIERRHLCRRKGVHGARGVLVLEIACSVGSSRDFLSHRGAFMCALPFVVEEVEEVVLEDGTADGTAKRVAAELRRFVGLAVAELRTLVEPVVSREVAVAEVLVGAAMQIVGAGLRDQCHLRAGGSARVGVRACCRYPELLSGVLRRTKHTREGIPERLVIVVQSVKRHIALVGTGTGHRAESAVLYGGGIAR